MQTVRHTRERGLRRSRREIDHEKIDSPTVRQRPGDAETLVEIVRGDDDEPRGLHPAGDGFDRVEGARHVDPGSDRAGGLRLRHETEGEGRLAARSVAAECEARPTRQPARAEDGVEGPEPRRHDTLHRAGVGLLVTLGRERNGRQRTDDVADGGRGPGRLAHPRSCAAPARLERRESGRHIGRKGHRTVRIERMF